MSSLYINYDAKRGGWFVRQDVGLVARELSGPWPQLVEAYQAHRNHTAQNDAEYVARLNSDLRGTRALLRSEGDRAEHWETEWHKAQRRSVLAHKRAHDNLWIGGVIGMAAGVLFSLGVGLL